MEKVKVDNTKCIGCGACVAIAPETFDFDDDGLSKVINDAATEDARSACESCPVEAIAIENVDNVVEFKPKAQIEEETEKAA